MIHKLKITHDVFDSSVIAQSDDCDYSESGWVAIVHEDRAYLANYSHCSCYDTFEALTSLGITTFDWSGTIKDLTQLAQEKLDPFMQDRPLDTKDCDYKHLMKVYEQVLKWNTEKMEQHD